MVSVFKTQSVGLLLVLLMLAQSANAGKNKCPIKGQVEMAEKAMDYQALLQLLPKLDDSACKGSYIKSVSLKTTQLIGGAASGFLQKGEFEKASTVLNLAPESSWFISDMQGDIAAKNKNWDWAAKNYNKAFELYISLKEKKKIHIQDHLFKKSAEALLLADNLDAVVTRSGDGAGIFSHRGFEPRKVPVPIQFKFGEATFSRSGRANAEKLANFLDVGVKSGEFKAITLTGHTDPLGSDRLNLQLSKNRAKALKDFLQEKNIILSIRTKGVGELEPPVLSNPRQYTEKEKHALARRVVLGIER